MSIIQWLKDEVAAIKAKVEAWDQNEMTALKERLDKVEMELGLHASQQPPSRRATPAA
ncbi:MAG: hypothetical protein ACRD52_00775 [Candidatus Acidiferrales bacterium]